MALETTLILFKPDCVEKRLTGTVLARFEAANFRIRGLKVFRFSEALLREHYAHIADKPFFPEVVAFMQKSEVVALALEGENAVDRVRALLGPTDSRKAPKGTIRGDYGANQMMNICHASDSVDNAQAELKRFFQAGELV